MAENAAAADATKSNVVGRNIAAGLLAGLGGVVAAGLAADGIVVGAIGALIACALALLLTSPGKAWRMRQRLKVPGVLIGVVSIVLALYGAYLAGDKLQAEDARIFAEVGPSSIAETRAALQAGDMERAERALSPIRTMDDPRIEPLKVALKHLKDANGDLDVATERLAGAAEGDSQKRSLYSAALADLNPVRATHDAEEVAANAAHQAGLDDREKENARITRHFSKWDGSHPEVVEAVKASMKDPSAFKHVETTAKAAGDVIIVTMTYRGTNSFGAVVTERVVAHVDPEGNLHGIARAD